MIIRVQYTEENVFVWLIWYCSIIMSLKMSLTLLKMSQQVCRTVLSIKSASIKAEIIKFQISTIAHIQKLCYQFIDSPQHKIYWLFYTKWTGAGCWWPSTKKKRNRRKWTTKQILQKTPNDYTFLFHCCIIKSVCMYKQKAGTQNDNGLCTPQEEKAPPCYVSLVIQMEMDL